MTKQFRCSNCGKVLFEFEESQATITCHRCKAINKFEIGKLHYENKK